MLSRHEEKFIIDYPTYSVIKNRARAVLQPDAHGASYVLTSIYFDDSSNTAYYEKEDGLSLHTKFRIRTYNCSAVPVQLERKSKHGIMTEKKSATIPLNMVEGVPNRSFDSASVSTEARILMAEMKTRHLKPTVAVRYTRDVFVYPDLDCRLTFDTDIQALAPDVSVLTDPQCLGIPALRKDSVIMEVKYGENLPAFIRKITQNCGAQLSVSKYTLCRDAIGNV